jgi:transposase
VLAKEAGMRNFSIHQWRQWESGRVMLLAVSAYCMTRRMRLIRFTIAILRLYVMILYPCVFVWPDIMYCFQNCLTDVGFIGLIRMVEQMLEERAMNNDWLDDGRKIPDEVMDYFRKAAVRAVRELGYGPELVAHLLGFSPSCIYEWLNCYDQGGYSALETGKAPGAVPIITPAMDAWLKQTVLESTPDQHGYDTVLWTSRILADLLNNNFGITVSEATVSLHLKQLGLSYRFSGNSRCRKKPKVNKWLNVLSA